MPMPLFLKHIKNPCLKGSHYLYIITCIFYLLFIMECDAHLEGLSLYVAFALAQFMVAELHQHIIGGLFVIVHLWLRRRRCGIGGGVHYILYYY